MKLTTEPVKAWFGYTRRERRASFILLIIVIVILVIRIAVPVRNIEIEELTSGISENKATDSPESQIPARLFLFDPNSASYDTLIKLGFDEREAKTLISYRTKGGRFRTPSDIKKVYGIKSGKAETLIPFVEVKRDTLRKSPGSYREKPKKLIDLNSCDTSVLTTLPGIGPVLSARIIKFRNLLGGFVSAEQLKEVYGLKTETFERIKDRVSADSSAIVRIKINSADYKELSRLVYLSKYEVTAILKYRQLKGRFNYIDDLVMNKLISPEKERKVSPYLDFE
jgi:competence protein ComEA